MEDVECAVKFWRDGDTVVEWIVKYRSEQNVKIGKGTRVICAVLGACLSNVQKEIRKPPLLEQNAYVDYTALKSENEILKSSVSSGRQS